MPSSLPLEVQRPWGQASAESRQTRQIDTEAGGRLTIPDLAPPIGQWSIFLRECTRL